MADPMIPDDQFNDSLEDPLIGRVLDNKYALEASVGVGGMATVYLAKRKHIGDRVAVKILNTGMPLSEVDLQRFELEARVAAKIKHPNIVSVFDFGTTPDGLMYLVMELLEGSSLERELEEKTFLDIDRTLELIQPICEAVNAAHAEGLIHRDLKPSNILLHRLKDGSEIVKVVDFGVAKVTNVNDTAYKGRLTKTGYLIGTPHYMPPEQIREQEITARSDIYSLGVIIYEMLSGCLPFNSDNVIDLLLAHLENTAKPLRELTANLPPGVDEAVMRAISKDPNKRQGSARDLYQEIYTAARGESPNAGETRRGTAPLPNLTGTQAQQGQRSTLGKKRTNMLVYDTLTGLYNNVFMNMRLEAGISESKATGDRTSVLLLGIDNFKTINQRFGFVTGDKVLKEFGLWLEQAIDNQGVVARYRGDEFLILCDKTDGKTAMQRVQELLKKIHSELMLTTENNVQLQINCSAGIAQFPGDGEEPQELIDQASLGLRQAKAKGGSQAFWLKQVQTLTALSPVHSFDIFVGRKNELEKLEREFDKTLNAQGHPFCIIGDTGIGKKRLLEEFRRRLTGKDLIFLQGRFFESSQAIPYKTIYESLHAHLSIILEDGIDSMRELFGTIADRIVKDFQEGESFRFFNATVQNGGDKEKYATFDYLTKIFLGLSKEHPVVLSLGDMEWADPLSLEFLSYLNQNSKQSRLLFVGCGRTESLADKHPLRVWLRNMSREGCETISLQPLSEPEVEQMVEAVFNRIVFPPSLIKMLYRETKGNPYFLVEMIRSLLDEGNINFRDGVWRCAEMESIPAPRSIIDALEARLSNLDQELLDLFAKAAVIGEEFTFELFAKITKMEEDELLENIDVALKAQILKEKASSGNDESYIFYPSALQKVLYARLNRRLRRTLHTQVGETLEKQNKSNPARAANDLAYHFHSAGDYQRSMKYAILGGLKAWRSHAIDDAQRLFTWAAEAAEKLGLMPGAEDAAEAPELEDLKQVAELTLNYGHLLVNTGRLNDAKKQLENCLELANKLNDQILQAKAYNILAELSDASSEYRQAIDYCQKAIAIAEKADDKMTQATSHCLIGIAIDRLGQYHQAHDQFQKALDFTTEMSGTENDAVTAMVRREFAFSLLRLGHFKDALSNAEEAFNLAKRSHDRFSEMIARSVIGQIYFQQGDPKKALEYYETALKMAGQLNRRRGQSIELHNIGEVHRTHGHYRQAIDCIQRSLEISREVGERQCEAFARMSLGLIYQATDSLDQALESLNQALQQLRLVSNKSAEAATMLSIAEIYWDQENFEESASILTQATDLIDKLGNPSLKWRLHLIKAHLFIIADKEDRAIDELRVSVGTIEALCDQLSPDMDRQLFLADKHEPYDLLTQLMESAQ